MDLPAPQRAALGLHTPHARLEFDLQRELVTSGHRAAWLVDCCGAPAGALGDAVARPPGTFVLDLRGQALLVHRAALEAFPPHDVTPVYAAAALRAPRLPPRESELRSWRRRLDACLREVLNAADAAGPDARTVVAPDVPICPVALCGALLGYPVAYDLCGPYAEADDGGAMLPGDNCLAGVPLTVHQVSVACGSGAGGGDAAVAAAAATAPGRGSSTPPPAAAAGSIVVAGFSYPTHLLDTASASCSDELEVISYARQALRQWDARAQRLVHDIRGTATLAALQRRDGGKPVAVTVGQMHATLNTVAL